MAGRAKASKDDETEVLVMSRRRCALCFGLRGDLRQKSGQVAHVDRDRSNSTADNLAFLCLEHHNEYDSKPSQAKGLTEQELRHYRSTLYSHLEKFGIETEERRPKSNEIIFLALQSNSFSEGRLNLDLRNEGSPFNILEFEATTPGARIRQWYPPSVGVGTLLRAPTSLPESQPGECIYLMKVRDRAGAQRTFQILVDIRPSPAKYDFLEVS